MLTTNADSDLIVQEISKRVQIIRDKMLVPRGGGSKPVLSSPVGDFETVDLSQLTGIVEYNPEEYTICLLAGTPLTLINKTLASNGQYLPFDPPMEDSGATIGGTVAAGLNGPGSYRFGGIRDFILETRFIDGSGRVIRGGARVVKNAAGFDLPKLMVGSLGQFGIIVNLAFKVFPLPPQHRSFVRQFQTIPEAVSCYSSYFNNQLDIDALNMTIQADNIILVARISGSESSIGKRSSLLNQALGGGEIFSGEMEDLIWKSERNFTWVPEGWELIKVSIRPSQIQDFENALLSKGLFEQTIRHYCNGGHLLYLAIDPQPENIFNFIELLQSRSKSALVITGSSAAPIIGSTDRENAFLEHIRQVLDPAKKFKHLQVSQVTPCNT